MNKVLSLILLAAVMFGCKDTGGSLFTNPEKEDTGLDFTNQLTETDDLNILDYLYFYNGGGVAVGDINNDGLPDIYISGNQVKNKLFLNQGGLKFKDITASAGVSGNSSWNTGVVMGDVNGDGLLDIYVCAVVGINGFDGYNELYINNGDLTFTESAGKYGLDFDTYSSGAAFLDYDLDGDLDIYLLNHAVHTQESFGNAALRLSRNYQTGDKLLRNDGGSFTDVSEEAGIYGGINGYGLGVAVADFNVDGYPDIYVGNDFHEDDYYYLNNGDGTFTESLKDHFGYTTRFSMGNDVADINHDGWPDLLSLDMLPEDEKVLKSSEGDDNMQTQKLRTERYGYHYQFTRNMLHLNNPHGKFRETALLSGIAATDWSWSSLFGDFDQDGEQDIFISNGIPKRPNDLDFINFVSSDQMRNKINNTKLVDQEALDMMPSGKVHNYIFQGSGGIRFRDMSSDWIANDTLISGATAAGDLDNDGDLDLVVNNIDSPVSLYINQTNDQANYLKLKFRYPAPNRFGIGTKVYVYTGDKLQYKELYTARGFQSSSEPILHFGFGKTGTIDSLRIVWPDKTTQLMTQVGVNQILEVSPSETEPFDYQSLKPKTKAFFEKTDDNLGIDFTHVEDKYLDFNRQKLIPYMISDRGPATAVGDLDGDGKEDIFFGGSKYIKSAFYMNRDSIFQALHYPTIASDSIAEDVSALVEDFNSDGQSDLLIGTGGGDFYNRMEPLLDHYYSLRDSTFSAAEFPEIYGNTSVLAANDLDNDGDLDVFRGSNAITADFGRIPNSHLLRNENGNFSIVKNDQLRLAGMVTDAVWDDFDRDGTADLILVGEWMPPRFFRNKKGNLVEEFPLKNAPTGLWQSIQPFDIDGDGDTDYLLGNWGLNSKFKAEEETPMRMYYGDLDANGSTETIIATAKDGKYYPLDGLPELSGQLVSLRKKFNSYRSFAGKTVEEVLDGPMLKRATILEVQELRTGYLENVNGRFRFVPLSEELQLAPVLAMLKADFDGDGKEEVLAGGNYFGLKPFHGRLGAFPGAMIKNKNDVILGSNLGLDLEQRSVRHLNLITLKGKTYLLVTLNNERAQVYKLPNTSDGK
ncbi:VCBS repeat-containing protein [Zeaxanthinibacter enoshimensis]|uniref:VCBS repeat protein n=1 Tax=Zeaxanthinibacter enoshimensis TaxID=392009 RepID=A0A4R6TNU0_9FLAO|nr:VCBS repeat-containing protein [Zeaxanthinibacter enoshimensis]TDQ33252.1 VCBS repeat protein [Zeaxanthinibacter enoshimensis]